MTRAVDKSSPRHINTQENPQAVPKPPGTLGTSRQPFPGGLSSTWQRWGGLSFPSRDGRAFPWAGCSARGFASTAVPGMQGEVPGPAPARAKPALMGTLLQLNKWGGIKGLGSSGKGGSTVTQHFPFPTID